MPEKERKQENKPITPEIEHPHIKEFDHSTSHPDNPTVTNGEIGRKPGQS
ncbi:hypothetical protein J2S00_001713 [Caldalkalibacillus uzonensis]|uniref:Uncharacterized protein n=1 Tax=Caldalkalibacillus uzonensis TaxID=353224 RepID=A0ABU0CV69_9BACI|nr:hypothetical protein [Caldalkalibacillus uzonensis]MDQ0338927.1 hypothetical protein [Caldalkalibacillus uzonensis]